MPTYDYVCRACDHRWELFESIKSKPSKKCPECGKLKAERLISGGGGIIFKGSGFYTTDYRSESYKSAAKSDSAAASPAAATSSETKTADAPAKTPAPSAAASAD
jgi:putative FmdB family regulatory protein